MAVGSVMPVPKMQFFDDNGVPLAAGHVYTYQAGGTTLQATYSDVGLTVANANPIVLDGMGRATVFLSAASYRFDLKTAADVLVWSQDNISATAPFNVDLDIQGKAGEAVTAGQGVYLSDGSGGKTNGQWYKADATLTYASSDAPMIGVVPNDIASGSIGSIRVLGRVSNLAGLSAGATYFATNVAGTLGTAAGTNTRQFGTADYTGTVLVVSPSPRSSQIASVLTAYDAVGGRLTLATGDPTPTADQTAKSTLYYTPYVTDRIALYDGSATWTARQFTELSIAVPATTVTMYDVFVYDNAGTPTLELLAWTNDTTRATAITRQNGRFVKSGATTRRYVGSFRTTAVSGQTEDSVTKRFLWNYYNRRPRALKVVDDTAGYAYTTATWRQAGGAAGQKVEVVIGVAEEAVSLTNAGSSTNSTVNVAWAVSIGEDSTSAPSPNFMGGFGLSQVTTLHMFTTGALTTVPTAGYHYFARLEISQAIGTATWYSGPTFFASTHAQGLTGTCWA